MYRTSSEVPGRLKQHIKIVIDFRYGELRIVTDVHFCTLLKCHGPCQRTHEGQERVIAPLAFSSSALYRGRRVSRRHVAATPNNGATKGINDGKESSLTSALICRKSQQSGLRASYRMHFPERETAHRHVRVRASRYVSSFTERTDRIIAKLFLLHGTYNY